MIISSALRQRIVRDLVRHKSIILLLVVPLYSHITLETAHIPVSLPEVSTLQLHPLAYIPSEYPTPRQCSTPTSFW